MNFRLIITLAAAGWLSACAQVSLAAATDNPYTPIVTRNIFGLVPIPVGPPPETTPATPPPKITPNGIMTIFGKLQALFKVAGVTKPGQPPKEESYVLGEGERQDDIEVQKIDEKSATITFNNHGKIEELPLIAGTAVGGESAPAGLGAPGLVPPPRPGIAPPAAGNPTTVGFGGRFGRPGNGSPSSTAAGAPSLGQAGNSAIYSPAASEAGEPQMSPEQRILMIEAQRQKYLQDGNPIGKLLPPTQLTPQASDEGGGGGSPNPP
jgi:hypothetical protein